jgi:hypothetical protein
MKQIDERFECLITKSDHTEAESAELRAIIEETMRAYPELFVQAPNGDWCLVEKLKALSESKH